MRAVVCSKYGTPDVLHLKDVQKPVPRADEVLIKIRATTCHIGDVRVRSADVPLWMQLPFRLYMGFRKPKRPILGMELSGVVEAAGGAVRRFAVGDAVLASCPFKLGAYADYICLPADAPNVKGGLVALKPSNMSFEEAAAGLATGGLTALGVLRKARIEPGRSVLIYGASGSVGVFAVQLAKYFGAKVTGVCSSRNAELVKALGADSVLDYTQPAFDSCDETFDVVFDAVGKLSRGAARRLSGAHGLRLSVARDIASPARMTTAELTFLTGLAESGKLRTYIDRRYSLEDIREAHAYVGQWRKRGHVVVTVDADNEAHSARRSPLASSATFAETSADSCGSRAAPRSGPSSGWRRSR